MAGLRLSVVRYYDGRCLYLKIHNAQKRQTSITPAGFEPATPASERPQTHILDREGTEIGSSVLKNIYFHATDFFHLKMKGAAGIVNKMSYQNFII